jgi:hypothetical protein
MERLLKLLLENRCVITYHEVECYDIVTVQDHNGNALFIQVIEL